MQVTFFVYAKENGEVFLALPGPPDNPDYLDTGEIWYAGHARAGGIKWDKVGVWESDEGVEIDPTHQYRYDEPNNELIDLGEVLR